MQTKANEQLFNEWNALAAKVEQRSAIVQNDLEIDRADIRQYLDEGITLCNEITELTKRTVKHLGYW